MNTYAVTILGGYLAVAAAGTAHPFDCPAGPPAYGVAAGVMGGYNYNDLGGGFVAVESLTAHPNGEWMVLEHCPTRQHLTLLGEPAIPADARNAFWRMVNSEESYTFAQMGDVILRAGVSVGSGQGLEDSCACSLEADLATRRGGGQ